MIISSLSSRSIKRRMNEFDNDYRKHRAFYWSSLLFQHTDKRKRFVNINLKEKNEHWNLVWFFDECIVELRFEQRREWVWWHDDEQWLFMMIGARSSKSVKMMIWAAIRDDDSLMWDFSENDDESLRGGVTARTYLIMLKENLPVIMKDDNIFMQDNAPVHTAKIVKKWLKEIRYKLLKNWPSYSPDLNSIEHFWFHFKELVYELHPELVWMHDDKDIQKQALRAAIEHAMEEMIIRKPYLIPALCESFKDRLLAVRQADGGPTRY